MKTTLTILSLIALSIGAYLLLKKAPEEKETPVIEVPAEEQSVEEFLQESAQYVDKYIEVPVEECEEGEKCF